MEVRWYTWVEYFIPSILSLPHEAGRSPISDPRMDLFLGSETADWFWNEAFLCPTSALSKWRQKATCCLGFKDRLCNARTIVRRSWFGSARAFEQSTRRSLAIDSWSDGPSDHRGSGWFYLSGSGTLIHFHSSVISLAFNLSISSIQSTHSHLRGSFASILSKNTSDGSAQSPIPIRSPHSRLRNELLRFICRASPWLYSLSFSDCILTVNSWEMTADICCGHGLHTSS